MSVIRNETAIRIANRMQIRVHHFAHGTYPESIGELSALPLNRFFLPIANPNGKACYISDRNLYYTLVPGYAYFIPPFHPAKMRLDEELTFVSIQFSLEISGGVDLFSHTHTIREIRDDSWLRRAQNAYEETDGYVSASLLRGIIQDFSALLLNEMSEEQLEFTTGLAEFQEELDYIQSHCLATTTVEDIASVRHFSREVFTRKFSAATGIPPKRFLARCLVNRACALLLRRNRLVREVAFELGFASEYYFSRFFKKHVGISPHRFPNHCNG